MNKRMMMVCGTVLSALSAAAMPEVTATSVSQDEMTHVVTLKYTLSEDAIVTLDVTTNGVSIGYDNYANICEPLSDVEGFPANRVVKAGAHTLMWRPHKSWPGYVFENGEVKFELKAWALSQPPDYMVIDLTKKNSYAFYPSSADLPAGGIKTADPTDTEAVAELTNDVYRTTHLVMRRIPAAGVKWRMGSPTGEADRGPNETAHYVTLTNDYYIGIYQVTRLQSKYIDGTDRAGALPWVGISYNNIRGSATGTAYCWPTNGHAVNSTSYAGKLQERTGLEIDLPTEAQWEFACRAGTGTPWCSGSTASSVDQYGWSGSNSKNASGTKVMHAVGIKKPNDWGLYDMHGNVQEWVLDQYESYSSDAVIDPVGPTTNASSRIVRGGSYAMDRKHMRSAFRRARSPGETTDSGYACGHGFRVCCPAVIPAP